MNNKGFTLLETVVVVTILGLIISSLAGLFGSSIFSFQRVTNQSELQQNLRTSLNLIVNDIRGAQGISSIDVHEIILINNEGQKKYYLDFDNKQKEHPYQLQGKTLYYKLNNSNAEPVALFIKELNFNWKPEGANPKDISFVLVSLKGELPNGKEIIFNSGAEIKWKSFGAFTQ